MRRGQVAVVTGGASGIGRALSSALADRGVEVVLADRDIELAEASADAIRRRGGAATAAELDVRDYASFEQVIEDARARSRRVDYLFNNAGIGIGGTVADYQVEDWDYVIDVNLRGVAYGIQAVYPLMREQGSGHIINTASMAGLLGTPLGSYTMTKHGVVGISKALRVEAEHFGVRVSALCPGAIETPILMGGKYGRKRGPQPSDKTVRKMWDDMRPMPADRFAVETLKAVESNDPIIIVPKWWRALWALERVSPRLSLALWTRFARKSREALEADMASDERDTASGQPEVYA